MGTFSHPITLIAPSGTETLEALVDAGSTFTSIPAPILERLGVTPRCTVRLRLADGRVREYPLGEVAAELDGAHATIICAFGESDSPAVIGAHTLASFLLDADPIQQCLVPKELRIVSHA
jgi:predicted aspartyl protease